MGADVPGALEKSREEHLGRCLEHWCRELTRTLFSLLAQLCSIDSEQAAPLWPALIHYPILIDKTSNSVEAIGDEYVYWEN
jgi:hypothetical protein